MTYEKEKEMQQELRQELAPQIAAALSDLLGQTWAHKPPVVDREWGGWYTYITGPGGRGIHAGLDRGRLNITGQWPKPIMDTRGTHTFYPYQDRPQITVGFGRGAQAIARDITRRFLPKYLPLWDKMVQDRCDYIDRNKRKQELLGRLAEAGGVTHKTGQPEVRIPQRSKINEPWAQAAVSLYPNKDNPTVDVKLENIPMGAAEEIMALVRQLCDKETQ